MATINRRARDREGRPLPPMTLGNMRQNGVKEATLYINQVPCSYAGPRGRPAGCDAALERMLLPGEKLTVYGPNGYVRVFEGKGP